MKTGILISLLFLLFSGWSIALRDSDRVIVLKGRDIQEARKKLLRYNDELKERDIVIKEIPSSQDFQIELYGKDGGKKWEADKEFNVIEILKLIDSMPMRKEEIRDKKE